MLEVVIHTWEMVSRNALHGASSRERQEFADLGINQLWFMVPSRAMRLLQCRRSPAHSPFHAISTIAAVRTQVQHCLTVTWPCRKRFMQQIPALPLIYEFDRHLPPRATIKPGETIRVESEDALSGQIRAAGDRRDKSKVPYSNPVAGPIVVEGAQRGDYLAVTIHDIQSRDGQCSTYTGAPRQLTEWLGSDVPHGAHVCPIRDGQIFFSDTIAIPYTPMLGCIGTAPDWGVPSTGPAGPHGGNMDLVEVAPGNTLFLPVFIPGGYLFLGDAHAAMGHGELSATGLEMAAQTTVTVDILRGSPLTGVRVEAPDYLMTVGTQGTIERAIAEAYSRLILWMEADYGWNRWQAYDLLTHVGTISVGHYTSGTVGTKIDKRYLKR